jgi:hypothetical protein
MMAISAEKGAGKRFREEEHAVHGMRDRKNVGGISGSRLPEKYYRDMARDSGSEEASRSALHPVL